MRIEKGHMTGNELNGQVTALHLGLAGGRLSLPCLPLERAHELRAAILDSMAATDFSRLPG